MAALTFVFNWLLAVLAVYRLAYLMTVDNGPARVFARLRATIERYYKPESWQAEAASCFFCQSVWYAAPAALVLHPPTVIEFGLYWLSIAGACAILHWWVLALMTRVKY